jgi:hypothetical protein
MSDRVWNIALVDASICKRFVSGVYPCSTSDDSAEEVVLLPKISIVESSDSEETAVWTVGIILFLNSVRDLAA